MASRIHELVDGVGSREVRSPYLDELQARAAGKQGKGGFEAVQAEILQEMADSYTRAQRRVDVAFRRLRALDEKIDRLSASNEAQDRAAIPPLARAFNEQRATAERVLWEFRVHREALGMGRTGQLRRDYPLPPPKADEG